MHIPQVGFWLWCIIVHTLVDTMFELVGWWYYLLAHLTRELTPKSMACHFSKRIILQQDTHLCYYLHYLQLVSRARVTEISRKDLLYAGR